MNVKGILVYLSIAFGVAWGIWGIWHYPLILLDFQRDDRPWLGLLVFPIFTILLSIIFGWLRLKTGSIWSVCLAHGATNAIGGSLTALLFLDDDIYRGSTQPPTNINSLRIYQEIYR